MRDFFFTELKTKIKEIAEISDVEARTSGENELAETAAYIMKIARLGRREGIIALGSEPDLIRDSKPFMTRVLELVVKGYEPDVVEDAALSMYVMEGGDAYVGLKRLMEIQGCLAIEAGENPDALEIRLRAMMPGRTSEKYDAEILAYGEFDSNKTDETIIRIESAARNREALRAIINPSFSRTDFDESQPERRMAGGLWENEDDESYFVMRLAEYVIMQTDDKGIKRLLDDTDQLTLALAVKGLSGVSARILCDNLTDTEAAQLAADMAATDRVLKSEVIDATKQLLTHYAVLVEEDKISCAETGKLMQLLAAVRKDKTADPNVSRGFDLLVILQELESGGEEK